MVSFLDNIFQKKDAEILINKLKNLGGSDMYHKCRHIHYLQGLNHTHNAALYKLLDLIDTAIDQNKKVAIFGLKLTS